MYIVVVDTTMYIVVDRSGVRRVTNVATLDGIASARVCAKSSRKCHIIFISIVSGMV